MRKRLRGEKKYISCGGCENYFSEQNALVVKLSRNFCGGRKGPMNRARCDR